MKYRKILIVGTAGGREHAVGWKVAQSPQAGELFFARGNAGTAQLGTNLNIKDTDTSALLEFATKEKIDLTLVLADDPLAVGVVDGFKKAGFRIWGPTKAASQLEWSKAFAKEFMQKYNIPTAKYQKFTDFKPAKDYVEQGNLPIVVKASGLALGKGVTVAKTKEEAIEALDNILVKKIFGHGGDEVVIEEFLNGTEISIHAVSDGQSYKMFPSSQDHKRVYDNDEGPNTGGMGTIAPLPFVDKEMMERIETEIVAPAIRGMKEDGKPFVGCLYPGIMLTPEGPKVFEFNARLGDPEAETYMRLLETDILDIIDASIDGKLSEIDIAWKNESACTVMLASGGYPGSYEKGKEISIGKVGNDIVVFHAGTTEKNGKLVTNGGRVLGVSATGISLQDALGKAYTAIKKISFEDMQHRKDIGKKSLLL